MSPDNNDSLDQLLRQKLADNRSSMPEGLLERVLDAKRRQKRRMFFWLNTAVAIYIIGLAAGYTGFKHNNNNHNDNNSEIPANHESEGVRTQLGISQNEQAPTEMLEPLGIQSDKNKPVPEAVPLKAMPNPRKSERQRQRLGFNYASNNAGFSEKYIKSTPLENEQPDRGKPKVSENKPEHVVAKIDEKTELLPEKIDEFQDTNTVDTEKKPKDKSKKNKVNGKGNVLNFDAWAGLGWDRSNQKLSINEFAAGTVHRDFASLAKSSISDLTGSSFAFGLRGTFKNHLTLMGGMQYTQMRNRFYINYKIKDIPVLDTSGERIIDYQQVPDSMQQTIEITRNITMGSISIPFQLGYSVYPTKNWQITGSVGLRPEFHFATEFMLPGRIGLTGLNYLQLGKYFSMPMTLSLGVYRKEDRFTYGVMGRMNPSYSKNIEIGNYGAVKYRNFDIGIQIMYNFDARTGKK